MQSRGQGCEDLGTIRPASADQAPNHTPRLCRMMLLVQSRALASFSSSDNKNLSRAAPKNWSPPHYSGLDESVL